MRERVTTGSASGVGHVPSARVTAVFRQTIASVWPPLHRCVEPLCDRLFPARRRGVAVVRRPSVSAAACTEPRASAGGRAAGYLHIGGQCGVVDRGELIRMMLRYEAQVRARRPERQVLSIERCFGKTVVSTTVASFAGELGTALQLAYCGSLDVCFSADGSVVHVYWQR